MCGRDGCAHANQTKQEKTFHRHLLDREPVAEIRLMWLPGGSEEQDGWSKEYTTVSRESQPDRG